MSKKRFTITIGLSVVLLLVFIAPLQIYASGDPPEPEGLFLSSLIEFLNYLVAWLGYVVLEIMSLWVKVTGTILDFTINYTIVDMKTNIDGISGIAIGWKAIRDLANMAFIFVLLYAAIGTILQLERVNAKRLIVNIIIVALFVNFSLFFTKVIIDASNIVAIGFYDNLGVSTESTLSEKFKNQLGIGGAFSPNTAAPEIAKTQKNVTGILTYLVGNALMILVASFIFLSSAILFLIRFGVLILLMILSPLAFVAYALPGLNSHAKKWWDVLIGQSLFAPAYMILLWLSLTILGTLNRAPSPDTASKVFGFLIVVFFLFATLILAKSFATQGASELGKVSGWAQKTIGKGVRGGAGFAGRGAFSGSAYMGREGLGRVGQRLANNQNLKDIASGKKTVRGGAASRIASRLALRGGGAMEKSSFDFRENKIVSGLIKKTGIKVGTASKDAKGGLKKVQEEKAKKKAGEANILNNSPEETASASMELDEAQRVKAQDKPLEESDEKLKKHTTDASTQKQETEKIKKELKPLEEKGVLSPHDTNRKNKLEADLAQSEKAEKDVAALIQAEKTVNDGLLAVHKNRIEAAEKNLRDLKQAERDRKIAFAKQKTAKFNPRAGNWDITNIFKASTINMAAAAQIREQTKERTAMDKLLEELKKQNEKKEKDEEKPPATT